MSSSITLINSDEYFSKEGQFFERHQNNGEGLTEIFNLGKKQLIHDTNDLTVKNIAGIRIIILKYINGSESKNYRHFPHLKYQMYMLQ